MRTLLGRLGWWRRRLVRGRGEKHFTTETQRHGEKMRGWMSLGSTDCPLDDRWHEKGTDRLVGRALVVGCDVARLIRRVRRPG